MRCSTPCPPGQKEAALALGATRWEMIRGAIFPHSRGGMIGAVMLGLGRAMGETIAVALVIGSSAQITRHLFASGDAMAAVIANQFGESGGLHRSALIGLGVVLFGITDPRQPGRPGHRRQRRPRPRSEAGGDRVAAPAGTSTATSTHVQRGRRLQQRTLATVLRLRCASWWPAIPLASS